MAEFFTALEQAGMPLNIVQTVGHTQVRRLVLGDVDRQAGPDELERMKAWCAKAMEAGAIGLSTALIYPPAVYASTDEIAALRRSPANLAEATSRTCGTRATACSKRSTKHSRSARQAGTPVHIFHLKAAGKANWPKMEQALAQIKAARADRPAGDRRHLSLHQQRTWDWSRSSIRVTRRRASKSLRKQARMTPPSAPRCDARWRSTGGWENWFKHVGSDWDNVVLSQIRAPEYAGTPGGRSARSRASRAKTPGTSSSRSWPPVQRTARRACPRPT